jgi:hypothetical protein
MTSLDLSIIILLAASVVLSPIFAFMFIKPNTKKYYCHEPGCGESFDSLHEVIDHLKGVHCYTPDHILDILKEYKKVRKN